MNPLTHTFIRRMGGMSATLSPPPVMMHMHRSRNTRHDYLQVCRYKGITPKVFDVGNQAGARNYRNGGLFHQAGTRNYRNGGLFQAGVRNYRNGGLFHTIHAIARQMKVMRLSVYQAYGNTTQTACSQPVVLMSVLPLAMMPQFLRAPTLAPFPPFLRAPMYRSLTSSPM